MSRYIEEKKTLKSLLKENNQVAEGIRRQMNAVIQGMYDNSNGDPIFKLVPRSTFNDWVQGDNSPGTLLPYVILYTVLKFIEDPKELFEYLPPDNQKIKRVKKEYLKMAKKIDADDLDGWAKWLKDFEGSKRQQKMG